MDNFGGPGRPPVFVAHRGGSLEAPENTLAAARHGVHSGACWQECDVALSADGVPVVIHDDTLERTTLGEGAVEAQPAAALVELAAGRPWPDRGTEAELGRLGIAPPHFGEAHAGETLPSLDAWLGVPGLCPMLELKKTNRVAQLAAAVVAALRRQPPARCVVGSFELDLLQAVHRLAPRLPLLGIFSPPFTSFDDFLTLPLAALAVDKHGLAAARRAAPAELPLWVWTVYSPSEVPELCAAGAHGIITDAPAACLAHVSTHA